MFNAARTSHLTGRYLYPSYIQRIPTIRGSSLVTYISSPQQSTLQRVRGTFRRSEHEERNKHNERVKHDQCLGYIERKRRIDTATRSQNSTSSKSTFQKLESAFFLLKMAKQSGLKRDTKPPMNEKIEESEKTKGCEKNVGFEERYIWSPPFQYFPRVSDTFYREDGPRFTDAGKFGQTHSKKQSQRRTRKRVSRLGCHEPGFDGGVY